MCVVVFWGLLYAERLNKYVTLYIAFVRAKAIKNFKCAAKSQEKSRLRSSTKLVMFSVLCTVLDCLACDGLLYGLYHIGYDFHQAFNLIALILTIIWTTVMATLSTFILVKLYFRKSPVDNSTTRGETTRDNFLKLVALVAVVFCITSVIDIFGFAFEVEYQGMNSKCKTTEITAIICNSSVNLFIYLFASSNFRADFCDFWRCCRILKTAPQRFERFT